MGREGWEGKGGIGRGEDRERGWNGGVELDICRRCPRDASDANGECCGLSVLC